MSALPTESAARKTYPLYRGLFKFFPKALAAVAHHSQVGGAQHGHDELYWDRNKSTDDPDALLRHVLEGDWAGAAWRALACLERDLEGNLSEKDALKSDKNTTVADQKSDRLDPDEGWIEWNGGGAGQDADCPREARGRVLVKQRSHPDSEGVEIIGARENWNYYGNDPQDIIAYRVIADKPKKMRDHF